MHAESPAPRASRCNNAPSRPAAAWCASASGSMPTPAPAIIPAFACRAALRSPSGRIPIRCGKIRSRTSTTPASAAGCAARSLTRRCSVPSFYRAELVFNPTRWDRWLAAAARRGHRRSCNDWRSAAGRVMRSERCGADRADRSSPALGGQGGGVLADWIVEVAERHGWLVQATSVPGVAQRTGTTVYYLEICPRAGSRRRSRYLR